MVGVYSIVNVVNGKVYVGSSVNIRERWAYHRNHLRAETHDNSHLQRAWHKYGKDAFEFRVCEHIEDREQLHIREQYWLDWHRLQTEVYNCGLVARHGMLGRKHTAESCAKMSTARQGKNNHFYGKRHSLETLERMRGRTFTSEHRQHISEAAGKPYPAFIHCETGEIIPAGVNLKAMCRRRRLHRVGMGKVRRREQPTHKGWELLG